MATEKQLEALARMREAKRRKYRIYTRPRQDYTVVNSYFYYMWNKWNEYECRRIWPGILGKHFWSKWCDAGYDVLGAAEKFWLELSDTNRNKLMQRARELYPNGK